jgi:hypothetical protein
MIGDLNVMEYLDVRRIDVMIRMECFFVVVVVVEGADDENADDARSLVH